MARLDTFWSRFIDFIDSLRDDWIYVMCICIPVVGSVILVVAVFLSAGPDEPQIRKGTSIPLILAIPFSFVFLILLKELINRHLISGKYLFRKKRHVFLEHTTKRLQANIVLGRLLSHRTSLVPS